MSEHENKNIKGNINRGTSSSLKGGKADGDGYLQVKSSGNNSTPSIRRSSDSITSSKAKRKPTRSVSKNYEMGIEKTAKQKSSSSKPVKKTESAKKPQQKPRKKAVEYSFATSGIFNNSSTKDDSVVGQAQKARKIRENDNRIANQKTRVIDTGSVIRSQGTRQGMKTAVIPAQKGTGAGQPQVKKNTGSTTRGNPRVKTGTKSKSGTSRFTFVNSLSSALIYISAVLVVSIILSIIFINIANDVFAFVKEDREVSITIEDGTDLEVLAKQLKELDVIKYEDVFKFYITYRGKDSDNYAPGTYIISPSMNYNQIISAITPKVVRETIVITIPEGYTTDDIIELFVSKGMGTREHFVDVIQTYDFSDYWFVAELPVNSDKYYRLEGYLFPDTYYFYTNMTEETIISKLLDNFNKKYTSTYKERATALGYTTDQAITLASIIQAEGKERIVTVTDEDDNREQFVDYGLISSVFYNRMDIGMKLQSDATSLFAAKMVKSHSMTGPFSLKSYGYVEDIKVSDYTNANFDNVYNTYYVSRFPPGAIGNPGLNAIAFALWPDSSKYYYFVSDNSGKTYFAETLQEHNKIVAEIGKE